MKLFIFVMMLFTSPLWGAVALLALSTAYAILLIALSVPYLLFNYAKVTYRRKKEARNA